MNGNKENRTVLTEWLEKLQQESWQLELLISGLALYGILESRELLQEVSIFAEQRTFGVTGFLGSLTEWFVHIAWTIGAINLFAHIFLRGLWIGAIGLRYVSGDIDYGQLKYSPYFQRLFARKIGTYDSFIERLEKICSTIFAYTFLLFFFFLSLNLFLIPMVLPLLIFGSEPDKNPQGFMLFSIYAMAYLAMGTIVFIDFISGGGLKKVKDKGFSKVYGVLYRIFSVITLSFLYRPILYNFLDNKYGKRWFYFSLPYIFFIAVIIPSLSFTTQSYFPTPKEGYEDGSFISDCRYDDLRAEALLLHDEPGSRIDCPGETISLSTFRAKGEYLEFFIPMSVDDHDRFEENGTVEPLQDRGLTNHLNITISRKRVLRGEQGKTRLRLEEELRQRQDSLIGLRKELIRTGKSDSTTNTKFDQDMEDVKADYESRLSDYLKKNMINIRSSLVGQYTLQLDGKDIGEEVISYFYIHPYRNTSGLKCLVSIEDLPKGMHDFSFRLRKKQVTLSADSRGLGGRETFYKDRIHLPFLKLDDPSLADESFSSRTTPPDSIQ